MDRNNLKINDYFMITPVNDFSVFSGFSCLHENDVDRDLDDFIHDDAERHHQDRIAVTYILVEKSSLGLPLAFATLQNDAIFVSSSEELPCVETYRYKSYPAVKIGRFGVRKELQGMKFGSMFLVGLKSLMLNGNRTGCRFITVDAWRDKKTGKNVSPFYKRNGFNELLCREKTSGFIPMYFDLLSMDID